MEFREVLSYCDIIEWTQRRAMIKVADRNSALCVKEPEGVTQAKQHGSPDLRY